MLSLEEYIAKRKKEDKVDELDFKNRFENIKLCVNYVLDYFTRYTGITEEDNKSALHYSKLDKFKKTLREFDPQCQEWLCDIYDKYEICLNVSIKKIIKEEENFLLFSTENEFRELSYDCYNELIRRMPFIKGQGEMIFLYIKNEFQIVSTPRKYNDAYHNINPLITEWIEKTYTNYSINIPTFVSAYCIRFCEKFELEHSGGRRGRHLLYDDSYNQYNYKVSKNLLNIDKIYERHSHKPFIKGHKRELELLLLYEWTHSIVKDESYWNEYKSKVLPYIK